MPHTKGIIVLWFALSLGTLIVTSDRSWAQSPSSRAFKTHAVCYRDLKLYEPHYDFIASHFDIVLTSHEMLASELKKRNPKIIVLKYKIAQSMHRYYPDWKDVDPHEEWFVHARGFAPTNENRLRSVKFDEYLMDPRVSGWQEHYAKYSREVLKHQTAFSGIYADNCWANFPMPNQWPWYRNISAEEHVTEGPQGDRIRLDYPLSERRSGTKSIRVNKVGQGSSENFFDETAGCSWKGNQLALNQNHLPGPPGTKVCVKYSAVCLAPEEVIAGWQDGIAALSAKAKAAISKKLLIGNSGGRLYAKRYLDVSDGVFVESFIHAPWGSGNWIGRSESEWIEEIEALVYTQKKGKWHMCHSGTDPDASTPAQIEQLRLFCYASFLLGAGPKATFYFACVDTDLGPPVYYPEWELPLGEPKGPYSVKKIGKSRIYQRDFSNGKAIVNPSDSQNAVMVDLEGEYTDEKGNPMTKIKLRSKHGVILVRTK